MIHESGGDTISGLLKEVRICGFPVEHVSTFSCINICPKRSHQSTITTKRKSFWCVFWNLHQERNYTVGVDLMGRIQPKDRWFNFSSSFMGLSNEALTKRTFGEQSKPHRKNFRICLAFFPVLDRLFFFPPRRHVSVRLQRIIQKRSKLTSTH